MEVISPGGSLLTGQTAMPDADQSRAQVGPSGSSFCLHAEEWAFQSASILIAGEAKVPTINCFLADFSFF